MRDHAPVNFQTSGCAIIVAAMTGSLSARLLMVSGGVQRSEKACGSLSPHGYYGIEGQVIDAAVAWIRIHGG
jgi:hypothetical protein